jgi:hypothetical protein
MDADFLAFGIIGLVLYLVWSAKTGTKADRADRGE